MQPLDPDPLVRGQVRITCTHECNTFFGKNLNTSNPRQVLHFYLEPVPVISEKWTIFQTGEARIW